MNTFTLNIDPIKMNDHKLLERPDFNPMVTKLEDLGIDSKQTNENHSFLYGNKDMGYFYTQCNDIVLNKQLPTTTNIPCFYCTEPFSSPPLAIPIAYVPSFYKEKESFISIHNENEHKKAEENGYTVYERDYFEVDGIFCSFPCMLSYIKHNDNGIYTESISLLKQMHYKLYKKKLIAKWAPDIRLLKKYGGHLTTQEWRSDEGQKYISMITINKPVFTDPTRTPLLVPVSKIYRYNGQK